MKNPSDAQASRWETAAAAEARGCRFDRLKLSYSDEIARNSNQVQPWTQALGRSPRLYRATPITES